VFVFTLAWSEYVKGLKNRFNEHLRIAKSYVRWKERQRISLILKVWRHQALFGRIDGLYTRQMLLKTVAEQKIFVTSLEKTMADQTMELEECKQMVLAEVDKKNELENEITKLNSENNRLRMANHHFEQELKRLESVVEAMALINPKQMEHLKKLQPDFKFKERNIALPESDPQNTTIMNNAKNINDNGSIGSAKNIGSLISDDSSIQRQAKDLLNNLGGNTKALQVVTDESESQISQVEEASVVSQLSNPDLGPVDPNSTAGVADGVNDASNAPANEQKELGEGEEEDDDDEENEEENEEAQIGLLIETEEEGRPTTTGLQKTGEVGNDSPLTPRTPEEGLYYNGPKLNIEEQRLLERVNWMIKRYKNALPEPVLNDNDDNSQASSVQNKPIPAAGTTPGIQRASSKDPGDRMSIQIGNNGYTTPKRNSLLRASNPFVKAESCKKPTIIVFLTS
jgi:hypothetical protein